MNRLATDVFRWGLVMLLLGACAEMHGAPPSQSPAPQARCSDVGGSRGSPGAVTASGSRALCE